MLQLTSVHGNIFADRDINRKFRRADGAGECERLFLSRIETEKLRLRRTTDAGTDVGIALDHGSRLRHGDVLSLQPFIVVEQQPEKLLSITIGKGGQDKRIMLAALIAHAIGNRHRPIAIERGTISFPLQADSEVEVFRQMLPSAVKMQVTHKVFLPSGEAHDHG